MVANPYPLKSWSITRNFVVKLFHDFKNKLPRGVYLLLIILAFIAVWCIFVVTSSASFNAATILFSSIRNGELQDLFFSVFFFKINAASTLASIFGVILEFGSLGLDFVISGIQERYLRTTLARNIAEKPQKIIQNHLFGQLFKSQFFLLLIGLCYAVLIFTVLGFYLSSDMNLSSLPTTFTGGQIIVPPVLHLPSDLWELIALAIFSFGLMAGSIYIIPQVIVAITEVFISEVLGQKREDKLFDDLIDTVKNIFKDKDDDFFS